jgi:hypothetical protein
VIVLFRTFIDRFWIEGYFDMRDLDWFLAVHFGVIWANHIFEVGGGESQLNLGLGHGSDRSIHLDSGVTVWEKPSLLVIRRREAFSVALDEDLHRSGPFCEDVMQFFESSCSRDGVGIGI